MAFPGLAELLGGGLAPGQPPSRGAGGFSLDEAPQARDRLPLEPRERRVAAGERALEVAVVDGSDSRGGLDRVAEPVRRAVDDRGRAISRAMKASIVARSRRVAPPPWLPRPQKTGTSRPSFKRERDAGAEPLLDVVVFGVIEPDGDAVGRDHRAVDAAPAVEVGRQRELARLRPHVDVHLVAGEAQDLRQAAAVAEGIEIVGDARGGVEVVAEIAPALGDRPDERFRPRQVRRRAG